MNVPVVSGLNVVHDQIFIAKQIGDIPFLFAEIINAGLFLCEGVIIAVLLVKLLFIEDKIVIFEEFVNVGIDVVTGNFVLLLGLHLLLLLDPLLEVLVELVNAHENFVVGHNVEHDGHNDG